MSKGSCELCGTRFNNVFEAVDHARVSGNESNFNPKFILSTGMKFGLGAFLLKVYESTKEENVRGLAEEAYSMLYLAEMRPTVFRPIYRLFVDHLESSLGRIDMTQFVYEIVSQEAYKSVGL